MWSLRLYICYCTSHKACLMTVVLLLLNSVTAHCLIFIPSCQHSGLNKFVILFHHLNDEVAPHSVQSTSSFCPMKSFIRRVPPRFETRMLHILICNLSPPCPCPCIVRKCSSVFESGIVIRSEVDRGEYNIRYTAIVAQQCGGCSYLHNAAGGDIGKSAAGSATGSSQILRTVGFSPPVSE